MECKLAGEVLAAHPRKAEGPGRALHALCGSGGWPEPHSFSKSDSLVIRFFFGHTAYSHTKRILPQVIILATTNYSPASTLPANIDAERSILGAILLDNFAYNEAADHLKADDFSLDAHRRIYSRMMPLAESSPPIHLVTLAEELNRHLD